ncbi:hypothetical protein Cni_G10078 [Canna indica]|uniref:X8 domain-containing protein n=1 Tax=Canna indica TaxID=4628 RepID=A0AAQ3K3S5_9LILI|nr:hypothetical protein Cni_G10078 [Canna indica]
MRTAATEKMVVVVVALAAAVGMMTRGVGGTTWCIARSAAGATALQAALDYTCGSGVADCAPVQANGLCYLPNSLAAHASYAFNSFYQRSNGAPGACDFSGTATVTITDPSYGSCTYPSSASTAGGSTSTPSTSNPSTPATTLTPPTTAGFGGGIGGGAGGLSPPGVSSMVPTDDSSVGSPQPSTFLATCLFFSLLL